MITKTDTDTIITAFGESCRGPGWSNQPIWVIVRDEQHNLRMECIQPSEQSGDMQMFFKISAVINTEMVRAVEAWRRR